MGDAFECIGSDGNTYTVRRMRRVSRMDDDSNPSISIDAGEYWCDSQRVNLVGKGHWKMTRPAIDLISDDPDAPDPENPTN